MNSDVNSDRAYEHIRKRILNGEYRLGQRLMAHAIAAEIDISPTPVRDALRQLEADGLVTIRPRMGAQVNAMGLKEFRELCELRILLESHTAALAAQRRTDSELREMEFALNEMRRVANAMLSDEATGAARLLPELSRADVQFHLTIMSAARNDLIRNEIRRLHLINRVIARASQPVVETSDRDHLRSVLSDHEAIYRAIAARDAPAAKQAMEKSLHDIMEQTIRVLARQERDTLARELSDEAV